MTGDRVAGHCDTCNLKLTLGEVVYTYVTPCTVETEQEAKDGKGYWAEDPDWGCCPECHAFIQAYDRGEMTREELVLSLAMRSIKNQDRQFVILGDSVVTTKMREEQAEFVVNVLKCFVDYKQPGFTEEVNGGVPRDR